MSCQSQIRRRTLHVLVASLAVAALAAPTALADDLRSPDARTSAPTHAQQRTDAFTGGVRAPDWLSPNAPDAGVPMPAARTPGAPSGDELAPADGFSWISAAIGGGVGIALTLIAALGAAILTGRSRPAPH